MREYDCPLSISGTYVGDVNAEAGPANSTTKRSLIVKEVLENISAGLNPGIDYYSIL